MKYFLLLNCILFTNICLAKETKQDFLFSQCSTSLTSTASIALARADLALCKSLITPNAFRGNLGESVAGTSFLKDILSKTGNWHSITPRSGPQGFDHLFIKTNSRGLPTDLIVGESKFNTSRLGITKDGIQMGPRWTNKRLIALGSRYIRVANNNSFSFAKMPLNPNRQINVILKNGKECSFWANSSKDSWKFSGTPNELQEARNIASSYGKFLTVAGKNIISYRSRIFHIIPNGNNLEINTYDATKLTLNPQTKISDLKKLSSIHVDGILSSKTLPGSAKKDIAIALHQKLKYTDREARKLANDIVKKYNSKELMTQSSLHKEIFVNSIKGSLIAMGIDSVLQFAFTGQVDPARLALTGGSSFIGITAGQFIHIGLTLPCAHNFIKNLSGPLHCSATTLTSSLSSFSAGVITTALLSYGLFFMGYMDLQAANRSMIVGSLATGTGTLFAAGTMAALATWGTASTGTAIATLSGAAATKASLALLGGGTLAAGGGGVALGTAFLTGGTVVVIAIIAYGGSKLFQLHDEKNETQRISQMIFNLSKPNIMTAIVNNHLHLRNNL